MGKPKPKKVVSTFPVQVSQENLLLLFQYSYSQNGIIIDHQHIDISNLTSGIYFIKIRSGDVSVNKVFLKN